MAFIWLVAAFFGLVAAGIVVSAVGADPGSGVATILVLVLVLGIPPAGIYCFRRRVGDAADEFDKPTFPRPPRGKWASHARSAAVRYMTSSWMVLFVAAVYVDFAMSITARLVFNADLPYSGWVTLTVAGALAIPASVWAYRLGHHEALAQLKSATPPALLRAHRLHDHAQALEDAMHEATVVAEELQTIIDGEKRLIADLLKEAADAQRVAEIRNEQMDALMARFDREQRRSTLRERWINIALLVIGVVAGYVLNLIDPDYFKNLFHK